jgi:hypothetical protein
MDHPWILAGSILASAPLTWITLALFLPSYGENLLRDGRWLLATAARDVSVAGWTFTKLPLFLLVCSIHIALVYNVALWLAP